MSHMEPAKYRYPGRSRSKIIGRAIIAAVSAGIAIIVVRPPGPVGRQWLRWAGTAVGIVFGFPLF